MKTIELRPIKESTEDFEAVEKRIKDLFRKLVYLPLLKELGEPRKSLKNATGDYEALLDALFKGTVTFSRGVFTGRFNAQVSKELKKIGARWDRKTASFRIHQSSLPPELRSAVAASELRFEEKLAGIDRKLGQILPDEIADQFKGSDLFDRTLWRTEKDFQASVKNITVAPQLTPERSKRIADEWQDNMKLWIKDFAEKEIKELRKDMKKSVFTGNRYESAVKTIQKSYGVTERKAKFLARQETSLLMTKFKETRYTDSGVNEYKWGCVAGSKLHPVRPAHKSLEGKIFKWDNPPITTAPGEPARRNNPGQDYNCRCFARPIVRFKGDAEKL